MLSSPPVQATHSPASARLPNLPFDAPGARDLHPQPSDDAAARGSQCDAHEARRHSRPVRTRRRASRLVSIISKPSTGSVCLTARRLSQRSTLTLRDTDRTSPSTRGACIAADCSSTIRSGASSSSVCFACGTHLAHPCNLCLLLIHIIDCKL
jgi:hypothetical protein